MDSVLSAVAEQDGHACTAMVEAHSTAACELDEYCWSVIASALTGLNDFHSTYCSLADLLSLAQVCRTTRRAAAVGLKGLDVCRGEAPACPLTRLELRFGESWIFSRSRYGEAVRAFSHKQSHSANLFTLLCAAGLTNKQGRTISRGVRWGPAGHLGGHQWRGAP